MQSQTITVIRGRGQLTIPGSMRGKIAWTSPGSVVTLVLQKKDEIVIKPYVMDKNKIDWNKVWKNIELARVHKGTFSGSLSQFIISDRGERR